MCSLAGPEGPAYSSHDLVLMSCGAAKDFDPGVSTSRWYETDIARWLEGDYKTLSADEES